MTKKLEAVVHTTDRAEEVEVERGHDRDKERLLPEDDPVFVALGISDAEGRIKPSRQAKYRQVEEFLRLLDASITDAIDKGHLRRPTAEDPLRIVDLGCGNAYLTFAAQRFLTRSAGCRCGSPASTSRSSPASTTAPSPRSSASTRSSWSAPSPARSSTRRPRWCSRCTPATPRPTRRWPGRSSGRRRWCSPRPAATTTSPPSCAATPTPAPYAMLTRHGILRERFADTLTDALRASLLRLQGYRVDVVQFVESQHTPRNTLLRAVRTGAPVKGGGVRKEYDDLVDDLGGAAAAGRAAGAAAMRERVARGGDRRAVRDRVDGRRRPSDGDVVFRFQDPEIVESSGLVAQRRAVRHHQRLRRQRPGLRRRPGDGRTVGVTSWAGEPEDVEALAPAGRARGLGRRHRRQRQRPRRRSA